jgi:nitrate/nitrite transporter NarK
MGTKQLSREGGALSKRGGLKVTLIALVLLAVASVLFALSQSSSQKDAHGSNGSTEIVVLP